MLHQHQSINGTAIQYNYYLWKCQELFLRFLRKALLGRKAQSFTFGSSHSDMIFYEES